MHAYGGLQHVEDALLVEYRGEDDGNVVERREALFEELAPLLHRVALLLDQVPLVHHDDAALAVAYDEVVDVEVLRFEALLGVEHQDADVRLLDGADRAHHRVEFEVLHRLALLAHAGRVHKVEIHAVLVVARMDRVARGACYGGHDVAFLAQQGVGHRRLAHVRTAHNGDVGQVLLLVAAHVGGQRFEYGVHQVARAAAAHRADAVGGAQAERVEFVRGVDLVVVIDLVAHEQHLFRAAPQHVCHHHVEVGDSRGDLDQEEDHVGLLDGQDDLTADFVLEYVFRIDGVTARVDDRELLSVPVRFAVVAVACGAGRGVHDCLSPSDQTVEERTFAHVGTSDDCCKAHNRVLVRVLIVFEAAKLRKKNEMRNFCRRSGLFALRCGGRTGEFACGVCVRERRWRCEAGRQDVRAPVMRPAGTGRPEAEIGPGKVGTSHGMAYFCGRTVPLFRPVPF